MADATNMNLSAPILFDFLPGGIVRNNMVDFMPPEKQMPWSFDWPTILQSISRIRFRGGVMGNVCTALTVLVFPLVGLGAVVCWQATTFPAWFVMGVPLLIIMLPFLILWKLINFADKHPQIAVLDGCEMLVHRQLELGTKSDPNLTAVLLKATEESQSVEVTSAQRERVMLPDAEQQDSGATMLKDKGMENG